MSVFARLTWIQRIALILFVTVVANWITVSTTGYSLMGGDLFTVLFIVSLILLVFTLVRPLMRRVVWRVRNRLFVTYFFVGVLPLALLFIFVVLGFYMVLGQTANYLLNVEIDRHLDQLYDSAESIAQDIAAGRAATGAAAAPGEQTVIRTGNSSPSEFPDWSMPNFKGLVRKADGTHFLAARADAGAGERRTQVFVYQPLTQKTLAQLLQGMASVEIITGDGIQVKVGKFDENPGVKVVLDSEDIVPAPSSRGFWDLPLQSPRPLTVHYLEDGRSESEVMVLHSRPSVILAKLFSTLGPIARVLAVFLLVIALTFLVVEIVAVLFSAQLVRTLTRTVHDLYIGTKRVETGDFSHRIPVRTKDQLSELATSFNGMTQRVEQLILEVKKKEKLEAELEIARQVQAQLFPKEVPILRTLELRGVCNPARVVSGDYYDFIPVDLHSTALIIGDISGKGISAALLMASVQSSLRAQLRMGANGSISTATLVERLNRQLYESTPPEKYATFYCGFYDDQNGRLSYTNAGHLAPIIVRRGRIIRLESNGMAVGMFPDSQYEQSTVDLQPGDLLTAFTDGITESENAQGEQFGERQLTDLLIRHHDRPLEEIMRTITDTVGNWASDLDNQDDTTMLLARRL